MALELVFFGTPDPAAVTLNALFRSQHRVAAVATAPDRPRGRGMELAPSPVKVRAEKEGVPVLQPSTLKTEEIKEDLARFNADVFVVTAYGFIVPQVILDIPRRGCFNVHFSLLPRLRGAAPVERALIEGDEATGITIIQMDAGLDTGPIVASAEELIRPDDTAGSLTERLSHLGAELMVHVLDKLEKGELHPEIQDESKATYASKITSDEARIDWSIPAKDIYNRIRAFNPRPGAWTTFNGKRLKLLASEVTEDSKGTDPGVIRSDGESLLVATGTSELKLLKVQPEGKGAMTGEEFGRGRRIKGGERLS